MHPRLLSHPPVPGPVRRRRDSGLESLDHDHADADVIHHMGRHFLISWRSSTTPFSNEVASTTLRSRESWKMRVPVPRDAGQTCIWVSSTTRASSGGVHERRAPSQLDVLAAVLLGLPDYGGRIARDELGEIVELLPVLALFVGIRPAVLDNSHVFALRIIMSTESSWVTRQCVLKPAAIQQVACFRMPILAYVTAAAVGGDPNGPHCLARYAFRGAWVARKCDAGDHPHGERGGGRTRRVDSTPGQTRTHGSRALHRHLCLGGLLLAIRDVAPSHEQSLGYLAEFLVARALSLADTRRIEWDAYGLLVDDRIRVEVKSSAYLHLWKQRQLLRIEFSGLHGTRYDPRHGDDPNGRQSNAHVYIFGVQASTNRDSHHPLDVRRGSFSSSARVISSEVASARASGSQR